ncbi:MAG TPA: ATP-dependent Clp protease proteolytic subunit [Planctomycetes bacterium]|nr:ATP-dependent Clp protease proteolytic subunit [Planctomycetota bacterium]
MQHKSLAKHDAPQSKKGEPEIELADAILLGPSPRLEDEEEQEEGKKGQDTPILIEKKLLESRTLIVSGPVTDKLCTSVVSRLLVLEEMDPEKEITVFINSPGGSADSGFAMYDMLKFIRCPIRTVVNGICASAAVLVFLAGNEGSRLTLPHSRFLIHQPSTGGRGTASDLHITAQQVLKLRDSYNKIISDATGRSMEDIVEDAARDFWLSAPEAIEYKLADRIIQFRAELEEK